MVKVFVSYCVEDKDLMVIIRDLINSKPPLKALIVLEEQSDLSLNSDKIKSSIKESKVFIPILTSNSLNNQWVNQEIGFAFGTVKNIQIIPLVEKKITHDLKGFINSSVDLNYRYISIDDYVKKAYEIVEFLYNKHKNHGKYYTQII